MSEYQVLARRYRPQTFGEILGQDPIVTTLKNAIGFNRLAHAYLFCGSRGTGKTTLARVFAKALNCANRSNAFEPCNTCSSCKEITSGHSLNVIEIDGASHRGIDDVRQINETVGYAPPSGTYKIYLIDEVHMLTKEAFNALLKTLEEPPAHVKFFFATTEPHKVLPTILSRCQRFNLRRISPELIGQKLKMILDESGIEAEEKGLQKLAKRAQGGLRDAEFLLDQILAFHTGSLTQQCVEEILGLSTSALFFKLDKAGKEKRLNIAYEVAQELFSEGKDLSHFLEEYTEHFRNLMVVKVCKNPVALLHGDVADLAFYKESEALYRKEQIGEIIEYLLEQQSALKITLSPLFFLENIFIHIFRTHDQIPLEMILERIEQIEEGSAPSKPEKIEKEAPSPYPKKLENQPKIAAPTSLDTTSNQAHIDTLLQFVGVEFEGQVEKH